MTPKNQIKKAAELLQQGETRVIDGKKTLILPYIEPEYTPKGTEKIARRKAKLKRAINNSQPADAYIDHSVSPIPRSRRYG